MSAGSSLPVRRTCLAKKGPKVYTPDQIRKIIDDYENLILYLEDRLNERIPDVPVSLDKNKNLIVTVEHYCRGWEDYDDKIVTIEAVCKQKED